MPSAGARHHTRLSGCSCGCPWRPGLHVTDWSSQVAHAQDDPVETDTVDRVTVVAECSGSERSDPGWLASLYRPEVPSIKEAKVREAH
jgi:hypothetical protein